MVCPAIAAVGCRVARDRMCPLPIHAGIAPIPLVRAVALQPLPEILDRAGVLPAEQLVGQIGGKGAARLLPLRPVLSLLGGAAAAAGDPGIGVRLAEAGGLAGLGELGRHLRGAETVGQAMERACSGIAWLMPGVRLSLWRDGTSLLWRADLPARLGGDGWLAKPWLLALLRLVLRAAAGRSWRPLALRCEQGNRLDAAFGQPVTEDAAVTGLVFPRSLLRLEMPPGLRTGDDLAALLEATRAPADFAGSLRVVIGSLLPDAAVDAAEVAQLAGISLRGLQRSLAAAGLSFSELLREARLERAVELMREPAQRMTDIGLELGYSDAANFTRAFRRWTGCSPRAYRRRLMEERA
jgi:AraC-like DNA-binding protein